MEFIRSCKINNNINNRMGISNTTLKRLLLKHFHVLEDIQIPFEQNKPMSALIE
jgi:hypothetical protein